MTAANQIEKLREVVGTCSCGNDVQNDKLWNATAPLPAAVCELVEAATRMLATYKQTAECGDCGWWDVEKDEDYVRLRAALKAVE